MDSDKMLISQNQNPPIYDESRTLGNFLISLFFILNMVTSILCIYSLPSVLQCINTYSGKNMTALGVQFLNLTYST